MIVNKASAHGLAVGHPLLSPLSSHTHMLAMGAAQRSMGNAWHATDDGVADMPMGSELHAIVSKIMS